MGRQVPTWQEKAMSKEDYPNPYQRKEAIGDHCPDGWTGECCATCSHAYGRPVKWPCHAAQQLRAGRPVNGKYATTRTCEGL